MSRPSGARVAVIRVLVSVLALTLPARWAAAQPSAAPRVEVAVLGVTASGGALATGGPVGTTNAVPSGGTTPYFDTDARVSSGFGAEVRASVRLWSRWFGEGGVSYQRPTLEVRLDTDVEQAAPVTATTTLTQVVVDGAVVRRLGSPSARVVPFLGAGVGYLRQLDDPRTSVGTGQTYFGGGGVLLRWGRPAPGTRPRLGLRADVRVVGYRGGLPLVDERPVGVVAAAGLSLTLW